MNVAPTQTVNKANFQRLQRDKRDRRERNTVQDKSSCSLSSSDIGLKVIAPGFLMQIGVSVFARRESTGHYRIGFVQKVDKFYSQHEYVDETGKLTGYARWEMKDKDDCVDSDVIDNMPYYSKRAFFEFDASCLSSTVEILGYLYMDDLPYTKATWKLDLEDIGHKGHHFLKSMVRDEKFLTWLVIQDVESGHYQPLFVIRRGFYYRIDINCLDRKGLEVPVEERARIGTCSRERELLPVLTFDPCLIPPLPAWLNGKLSDKHKTANDTMRFVWYRHRESTPKTINT